VSTFSFLYRNERTATWNDESQRKLLCTLSVSSIGTNELQHLIGYSPRRTYFTFSFLYRNERTATTREPSRCFANKRLSVSSIGTNELQLPQEELVWRGVLAFQFPLSERTNCNLRRREQKSSQIALSVSSIGTNELQLNRVIQRPAELNSFQFPLSERTNCNPTTKKRPLHSARSFSFLYRNERTATGIPDDALAIGILPFSFLYRNERTATAVAAPPRRQPVSLSVSSIGTNELQLRIASVAFPLRINFQFPLSERTNCNMGKGD